MVEKTARCIGELLDAIAAIRSGWGTNVAATEEIWFRGDAKRSYPLVPAFYRPHVATHGYDEFTLFERFKALAAPLVRVRPDSDWEWYFIAQHYGLPTRLLDWTENLFAALYFAIQPHARAWDRPTFESLLCSPGKAPLFGSESPVVWVLEVGTLNKQSLGADCVAAPGGPRFERYLPKQLAIRSDNEFPAALLPPRASDRIVAQQGMFTIHGYFQGGIDQLARGPFPDIQLAAVVLDQNNIPRLWEEIQMTGVNLLSLFPELSSVAPHVCWLYQ